MTATMEAGAAPFSPRMVLMIVGAGLSAFLAFLLLIAFAPELSRGQDARGHALSVSGNGYAGLVELAEAVNSHALIVRQPADLATRALLIVTPEPDGDPGALSRLLARRAGAPTLIVLPKWIVRPMERHRAWSERVSIVPASYAVAPLRRIAPQVTVETIAPASPRPGIVPSGVPRLARSRIGPQEWQQRLAGTGIVPLLLDGDGRILLGRLPGSQVTILAEPDLLDNQGLADPWTARQGWQLVDDLMTTNELAFDLTLNGFASQRSPLRLAFEPPFLPVTLCILAAGLLAGWHGAIRFGAPQAPARAVALGKRALVDNAALLFRAARKEHRAGTAYADLSRDLAARDTAAPAHLGGDALGEWLDRAGREGGDPPYATLAWRASVAEDRDQLLSAARALYRWRRNRTR